MMNRVYSVIGLPFAVALSILMCGGGRNAAAGPIAQAGEPGGKTESASEAKPGTARRCAPSTVCPNPNAAFAIRRQPRS